MAQKKKWSAAAKFEIVLLALKGEKTINEICKRYEVAPGQVHLWKKQFLEKGSEIFSSTTKVSKDAESESERQQSKLYDHSLHTLIGFSPAYPQAQQIFLFNFLRAKISQKKIRSWYRHWGQFNDSLNAS